MNQRAEQATQPAPAEKLAGGASSQYVSNFYVARMSRRQALDLSNSVQQDQSQKAELKDLPQVSQDQLRDRAANFESRAAADVMSAPAPATLPATEPAGRLGGAGGSGEGMGRGPATRPAERMSEALPTQPAESSVNLVIVVQPQPATTEPASTTQVAPSEMTPPPPTTQPATQPAISQ